MWNVRCERSSGALYVGVHGRYEYGESMCSCIAAIAVTGLNVDPGGYSPEMARFSDGMFFASAVFSVRPAFASSAGVTWPA